ncbi:MAG: hypothetical protein RR387_00795 [Clostridiales bacterium]
MIEKGGIVSSDTALTISIDSVSLYGKEQAQPIYDSVFGAD